MTNPFESEKRREEFLLLLAAGRGRYEALEALGISQSQYRYYLKNIDPSFRMEIRDAQDASTDAVLEMARKRALDEGDVAWASLFLRHQRDGKMNDPTVIEHNHRISLSGMEDVLQLQAKLEGRKAEAIEATATEKPKRTRKK